MLAAAALAAAAAAQAPGCGGACNDGVHICDPAAMCGLCMPSPPSSNTSYKCLAGCGNPCTAAEQCGTAGCAECVGGKCAPAPRPPQSCGGVCNDGVHVCDPAGECSLCIPEDGFFTDFRCSAGCGKRCTADAHCGASGCGICSNGTCTPPGPPPAPPVPPPSPATCGQVCNDGVHDCDPNGECTLCIPVPNAATFRCAAGCGKRCTADAHCGSAGCGDCDAGGMCRVATPAPPPARQCNARCMVDADCAGECDVCVPKNETDFQCSARCKSPCTVDAHCGETNCNKCVAGACASA